MKIDPDTLFSLAEQVKRVLKLDIVPETYITSIRDRG
jgi:hypothetical protein